METLCVVCVLCCCWMMCFCCFVDTVRCADVVCYVLYLCCFMSIVCVSGTHQCDGEPLLQLRRIWHREPNRGGSGPNDGQLALHTLGIPHHTPQNTHTPQTHSKQRPRCTHTPTLGPLRATAAGTCGQPSLSRGRLLEAGWRLNANLFLLEAGI